MSYSNNYNLFDRILKRKLGSNHGYLDENSIHSPSTDFANNKSFPCRKILRVPQFDSLPLSRSTPREQKRVDCSMQHTSQSVSRPEIAELPSFVAERTEKLAAPPTPSLYFVCCRAVDLEKAGGRWGESGRHRCTRAVVNQHTHGQGRLGGL